MSLRVATRKGCRHGWRRALGPERIPGGFLSQTASPRPRRIDWDDLIPWPDR